MKLLTYSRLVCIDIKKDFSMPTLEKINVDKIYEKELLTIIKPPPEDYDMFDNYKLSKIQFLQLMKLLNFKTSIKVDFRKHYCTLVCLGDYDWNS